jgi:hypothetical protein
MDKINLLDKFGLFSEHWSPKIVGELNGQHVKLAKLKGEFIFHRHENEDELFLVIKGKLKMEFRDKIVELSEGEVCQRVLSTSPSPTWKCGYFCSNLHQP